jgi:hypothetical protein
VLQERGSGAILECGDVSDDDNNHDYDSYDDRVWSGRYESDDFETCSY